MKNGDKKKQITLLKTVFSLSITSKKKLVKKN